MAGWAHWSKGKRLSCRRAVLDYGQIGCLRKRIFGKYIQIPLLDYDYPSLIQSDSSWFESMISITSPFRTRSRTSPTPPLTNNGPMGWLECHWHHTSRFYFYLFAGHKKGRGKSMWRREQEPYICFPMFSSLVRCSVADLNIPQPPFSIKYHKIPEKSPLK